MGSLQRTGELMRHFVYLCPNNSIGGNKVDTKYVLWWLPFNVLWNEFRLLSDNAAIIVNSHLRPLRIHLAYLTPFVASSVFYTNPLCMIYELTKNMSNIAKNIHTMLIVFRSTNLFPRHFFVNSRQQWQSIWCCNKNRKSTKKMITNNGVW